jgi:hypothetical protein
VNTVLHVTHHDHDHDVDMDHEHDSVDHDAEDLSSASGVEQDFSHQDAPGQPVHSHDKDIWGLFANPGLSQHPSVVKVPAFVFLHPPVIEVDVAICELFSGSLLRPPIA